MLKCIAEMSPRRMCNPCGCTMKIISRYYNRLLIYDVKRTTKIDGMGPLKLSLYTGYMKMLNIFVCNFNITDCNYGQNLGLKICSEKVGLL